MSRLGWWLGGTLAVAGALVLIGYGAYYFTRSFFGSSGVPIAVQVAVPAMVFGALVLSLGLLIADQFETLQWPVLAAMVVCWCTVFTCRQLVVRHNLRSCPLRNGDRVTEMICVRVSKQDRIRIHIVGCAGGFGVACQKRVNKDGLAAIGNKKAGMAEELDVWHDGVS